LTAYKWIGISAPSDYDQLVPIVDEEFSPEYVVDHLKKSIRATVRGILVEYGYNDKDYRSTYYRFYAKKGRHYRSDCIRLHLFDEEVRYNETTTELVSSSGFLDGHYFGFIVLRPTMVATIGRSILSPDVRTGAHGRAIQGCHRVHLLGRTLSVWGFPSMSQHIDISVCAHVSCWAILRHYSESFPQHRELLLHDITMLATPFDPGGITPSLGLDISEAERIFHAAGAYPVIAGKQSGEELRFYAQMLAYLESGFPLFVVMDSQEHAIVLAGYAWCVPPENPPYGISHAWEQIDCFLSVDDNLLPYGRVPVDPTTASTTSGPQPTYNATDFDAFIVPLPEKIFYPATAIERQSAEFYDVLGRVMPMPARDRLLRRYFITTISELRRFAHDRRSEMGDDLVSLIMRLETAQFIWVVEYASYEQWCSGHVAVRAIVDATASPHDPMPVWFVHGEHEAIAFDRSTAAVSPTGVKLRRPAGAPLGRMEQNLRPIR
jgi:hypothetical protein